MDILTLADQRAHCSPRTVIERAPKNVPPLYQYRDANKSSPLRRFIALPEKTLLVLGARRTPPVAAALSNSNTDSTVSVCTSVGFRTLETDHYARAVETLQADIIIGLGDIPYERTLGSKRIETATDRNIQWLEDHIALRKSSSPTTAGSSSVLFASLLPVRCYQQRFFVDHLAERFSDQISGLAIFSTDTLEDLPEELEYLPRLALTSPNSPHQVLRQISLGTDILTMPFITTATDAGIALQFDFPIRKEAHQDAATDVQSLPLGLDMWSAEHVVDLSPLSEGCKCYACTAHHRAFIQHLLMAKEMLGWVLIQIHNHHVLERFFHGIRESLAAETFEHDVIDFTRKYESHLPEKTGQGPRYVFKADHAREQR
jgi:queuine tRNA-ribosyltransferase